MPVVDNYYTVRHYPNCDTLRSKVMSLLLGLVRGCYSGLIVSCSRQFEQDPEEEEEQGPHEPRFCGLALRKATIVVTYFGMMIILLATTGPSMLIYFLYIHDLEAQYEWWQWTILGVLLALFFLAAVLATSGAVLTFVGLRRRRPALLSLNLSLNRGAFGFVLCGVIVSLLVSMYTDYLKPVIYGEEHWINLLKLKLQIPLLSLVRLLVHGFSSRVLFLCRRFMLRREGFALGVDVKEREEGDWCDSDNDNDDSEIE